MMKYLEDSEDLKVSLGALKDKLESPEETGIAIMQIAKQARKEGGQKIFQIFRQEENDVCIASLARWDRQLKGLVERRCQELMQEVELLSERQEVLAGLLEDMIRIQSKATEKYNETIFEELKVLEEKKSKEALVLVQKKHILTRCQSEGERARMLKRLGGSRAIGRRSDAQDTFSFESCSSSIACDMEEEVSSESSKKMKDMDEITSEASWTAVTKGKEKEAWSLEPEGEAEKPGAMGPRSEVKGISLNPEGEGRPRHARTKMARKERENQTKSLKEATQNIPRKRERRLRVRKEKLFG